MDQVKLEGLAQRAVEALERLAEDPVISVETGLPACPYCEKVNPNVRVDESSGEGPLGEFIIQAHCTHCNNVFYAVPLQWQCVKTISEAEQVMVERGISGFNGGTNSGA